MKLPTPSPGFLLESSVILKTVAKSASFRLFHAETGNKFYCRVRPVLQTEQK